MLQVVKNKHRHHSLTGRITMERMVKAFKAVYKNRGAAGLDGVSIKMFAANLDENLACLMKEMKSGSYVPIPLRRKYIPKGKNQKRPLGIPAVRCRVAQEVVRSLIAPIFERGFHDSSHGFRPNRSCHTAMAQLMEFKEQGYVKVVDADIEAFFDTISQRLILQLVAQQVSDGNILDLIKKFLRAGVMQEGIIRPTRKGTPQGGVISPLLANIVLNHFDWTLQQHQLKFVRYADDFLVLTKSKAAAQQALAIVKGCIEEDLQLVLHPEKTQITSFYEGFEFLGFYISSRTIRMGRKAEERLKDKIRKQTIRSHNLDLKVVKKLNQIIRGTVNYFACEKASCLGQFNYLDRWIRKRIRCMKFKRISRNDNRRMQNRVIKRKGFLTCREVYLSRKETLQMALP